MGEIERLGCLENGNGYLFIVELQGLNIFTPYHLVFVAHLLSDLHGEEVDVPFEVTNEEEEVILFSKSSFILGRSGTGKTTVLTMKLFQKEQQHHFSVQGLNVAEETRVRLYEENEESQHVGETSTLHQLFVTVSPLLCYAVNLKVSQLKRFNLKWKLSKDRNLRSVALETLISEKEISYDRFCCCVSSLQKRCGVDFRFADVRSLFYTEFFMGSKVGARREDKGHVLKPETSVIYGAAPVLLKPGKNENAIITIFGNKEENSGKIAGFGAEQVVLVRESTKQEVYRLVGQKALILTIVE
ncbi:hypothetical protein HAX54_025928 [Datura stramonium]|uniref:Uncharacterized protein n=1 Tax=Datura stramonium TaxID=4076 RepID=A0ABS8V3A5_DATST|nr:hypothetical protein [Datura stramonium]